MWPTTLSFAGQNQKKSFSGRVFGPCNRYRLLRPLVNWWVWCSVYPLSRPETSPSKALTDHGCFRTKTCRADPIESVGSHLIAPPATTYWSGKSLKILCNEVTDELNLAPGHFTGFATSQGVTPRYAALRTIDFCTCLAAHQRGGPNRLPHRSGLQLWHSLTS